MQREFGEDEGGGVAVAAEDREPRPASHPASESHPSQGRHLFPDTLRGLYERYCGVEADELVSLLSRSALRDFIRRAAAWEATSRYAGGSGPTSPADRPEEDSVSYEDAIARVRRYARSLLPLPPYEVWVGSYLENREAYLAHLGVATAPVSEEPVMVELRELGDGWYAALQLAHRDEEWLGSIQFHRTESNRSYRTADIFREEDPAEIRARFLSFDPPTLRALTCEVRMNGTALK